MFKPKIISFGLVTYFALRVFSYFFTPSTPLFLAHPLNTLVAILVLTLTGYLLIKRNVYGWYLVAGEIILGGGGNFLEVSGIALRTWILLLSLSIYLYQTFRSRKIFETINKEKAVSIFIFSLLLVSLLASIRGYLFHHSLPAIWSDFLPYVFLFHYYPLRELLADEKNKNILLNLLFAGVVGNFAVVLITFFGFVSGIFVMQNYYYHWYRDVTGGKITPLPFDFYRLVLNEHLLLVPLILMALNKIIKKEQTKKIIFLLLPLLYIFSLNLTRIYLVALALGMLLLFSRNNIKRWLIGSALILIIFFSLFTLNHTIASSGKSLGWEIFGLRLQSITAPQLEDSSLSRLLLLPKIVEKIKAHPLMGTGLGDTITVFSPVLKQTISTAHFDWGYLEIWAEMGLYGLLAWLGGISYILYKLIKEQRFLAVACIGALGVINLTSPGLFHVFGVILITTLLSLHTQD